MPHPKNDPSVKINFRSTLPHEEVGNVLGKRHRDEKSDETTVVKAIPVSVTETLKEKLLYEVFTSLKYLDSLDNGFSMMVRIPGTLPVELGVFPEHAEIEATKLIITAYLTEDNSDGYIAKTVQTFATGVAVPYLRRLRSMYKKNKHRMLTHVPPPVLDDNSPFIPSPEDGHPSYFKLQAFRPGVVDARLDKIDEEEFDRLADHYDWGGLCELADRLEAEEHELAGQGNTPDAEQNIAPLPKKRRLTGLPIVDIGWQTYQALDLCKLSYKLAPYLCTMAITVRSSRWAEVLEGPEFGLTSAEAMHISAALLNDAKVAKENFAKKVKIDNPKKILEAM